MSFGSQSVWYELAVQGGQSDEVTNIVVSGKVNMESPKHLSEELRKIWLEVFG